jgi:glutaredoxin 3
MVCIPCIVIPFVLWLFHKYIQPFVLKFWNPWEKKGLKSVDSSDTGTVDPAMADSQANQYIQKMIKENKVMVFSKPLCPYCLMAKEVLDGVGVVYTVDEIDLRPDCAQIQNVLGQITGGKTVPRVFIGGKCIGGGSETFSLHNQGRLVPLLQEVGASFKKLN